MVRDNPIYTSILMKFTEVNKYATITHHILTECPSYSGIRNSGVPCDREQQKNIQRAQRTYRLRSTGRERKKQVEAISKGKSTEG
jgi:TRAP-type C4-dicarboxylate transport system substrate-binding protein